MTMTTVDTGPVDDSYEGDSDDGPSDEEGSPPQPSPLAAHFGPLGRARPNGVWFGPKTCDSDERKLIAFLGSHNGVAVFQWPRDAHRAQRFFDVGIPCLWLIQNPANVPPGRSRREAWLPRAASDMQIHACLQRLCDWSAMQRSATPLELEDNGWLHLGKHGIKLTAQSSRLAATLVAHIGEAVDDCFLAEGSVCAVGARPKESLDRQLGHLDEDINALGLEVVPTTDHAHLLRRCRG
jgi:hypothetical protein